MLCSGALLHQPVLTRINQSAIKHLRYHGSNSPPVFPFSLFLSVESWERRMAFTFLTSRTYENWSTYLQTGVLYHRITWLNTSRTWPRTRGGLTPTHLLDNQNKMGKSTRVIRKPNDDNWLTERNDKVSYSVSQVRDVAAPSTGLWNGPMTREWKPESCGVLRS